MQTLERVLAGHRFFSGMDPRHLQLAVGCAANVRFNAGELICREGEQADQFYLIRAGKIALETSSPGHGSLVVQTLGDGDILGWSWLVPPYHWRFDARAAEMTRAIGFDGKCLRQKCEEDHELGYELQKRVIAVLGQYLDATRFRLLDIYRDAIE
ncbi:cyclic nucleotide-binding domain-containing protein [Mycobacterium kansasii]|uniref:Cyclic nucleotide-binding domain protein n=3 Tax=Mycobacterium kansasii TaxID=1768 RepID=A0A653F682_MYCKA|nr:cyclic nucleotide-binding domain-containing protein [Mycobacterium kansasii]EUA04624.1 cyclic nucleotide-binding domain protein [Mycobacterium kansasii 824]AGZ52834.1 Crp/Fnr family transcriptional regulator [Mycobacterium kansasii ATCC 12478]ARG55512.1 Crp/Fnr family transcriptional regulator [Mycobacterium kansasii]ARG60956.1 Crp/Fnr family transcriptional regulator [Mycobacterium kansasii]ARG68665.1 Crp/Fnr family transcriptional regulator [Mycobacterium kansasii]